ncbi:MAG: leucyl/phenylalanyl-tRNA--protein transferase [Planctomycetaceae bacterium]|nr:leucyl/phenylalanyl-tRNA--protein transferase [Planctomycetaceae bacterium]
MSADPGSPANPLTAEHLIAAYCQGAFPMAESRTATGVQWFRPDPRAILPLDTFHCPDSLARVVRADRFDIRHDTAFDRVIRACAKPRRYESDTWINEDIIRAYGQLHLAGLAHTVEAWHDNQLVGGLYGVALGAAFFGESMFHDPDRGGTNASKVCLVHLVDHLNARGYTLLDVQFPNPHLAQFGLVEIREQQYAHRLNTALHKRVTW